MFVNATIYNFALGYQSLTAMSHARYLTISYFSLLTPPPQKKSLVHSLLQEHCVTLNTYRDLYYIQVTYATRVLGSKGEPLQKLDFVTSMLNKWRRLAADKPWADVQRLVADEMTRLESGQLPISVRASRAPRHRTTVADGLGVRRGMFKKEDDKNVNSTDVATNHSPN
ncbi:hypothetical protein CLF_110916 [Clonorchis sinensis]|uniref:Uncharacterized protein n=1 Tax=Clonorchis sinensis TaxID=79923 RepID=H2KSZ3_CLOSI|nr:hypothetical protein CLF_110916 [Clonorchis sinensis]